MTEHMIGEITLSISSIVYVIWFLPQLWLNFKRKNTDGLSLWMHGLLLLGYSADLLYGFGRDMQWQYRMVTIVGIACLLIQHIQFGRYGLHSRAIKINYFGLTVLACIVYAYSLINFTLRHHSKQYYDIAGFLSDVCWMTYLLPQIIKNFMLKSTAGLSVGFVTIAVLLSILDILSTFTLHWDWPSVLASSVTLVKKGVLVFQMVYYRKRTWSASDTRSPRASEVII